MLAKKENLLSILSSRCTKDHTTQEVDVGFKHAIENTHKTYWAFMEVCMCDITFHMSNPENACLI